MAAKPELPLVGGCGCGTVRFEVIAPLESASYCHCTRCQRRSGTGASANARPRPGSFRVVSGEERLRAWRPAEGSEKWFCGDCGSAVFSRKPHDPERMSIRLGAFDGDPGITPRHGSRPRTTGYRITKRAQTRSSGALTEPHRTTCSMSKRPRLTVTEPRLADIGRRQMVMSDSR
jgi:hypothetical protein